MTSKVTELSSWYSAASEDTRPNEAQHVFNEVWKQFASQLSEDKAKKRWTFNAEQDNLNTLLEAVMKARFDCEARKGNSKIREVLVGFSETVYYYSGIMDVLVSHHPEYVALAYGAIKFLFVGVVNQQKLLSQLCTGLSKIASILPRAELLLKLYPTATITEIIVDMYTNILRFLLRALGWYQESKAKHVLHSITRPAELRYNDILSSISALCSNLMETAATSSYAEQRDMHRSIAQQAQGQKSILESLELLRVEVSDIKRIVTPIQSIKLTASIPLHQQLSQVQLSQLISGISIQNIPDPMRAFKASVYLMKRPGAVSISGPGPEFWLGDKIQTWNQSEQSSLVIINGTKSAQSQIKYFYIKSISSLLQKQVPVIWVLKTLVHNANRITTLDVLKYLATQAIQVNKNLHIDQVLSEHLKMRNNAKSEEDWTNVLLSAVHGIPLLYIIVDLEVLSRSINNATDDFWPVAISHIFRELSQRNINTVLRVALVNDRSTPRNGCLESIVHVGKQLPSQALAIRPAARQQSPKPNNTTSVNLNVLTESHRAQKRITRAARQRKKQTR